MGRKEREKENERNQEGEEGNQLESEERHKEENERKQDQARTTEGLADHRQAEALASGSLRRLGMPQGRLLNRRLSMHLERDQ